MWDSGAPARDYCRRMPRISAPSLGEHREQVHRLVFDAFTELVTERGYDAVSMAQIAARAGIGRTAIYHHFPDKESVVVAIATHETSQYLQHLQDDLEDAAGPSDRLRTYIRHHLVAGNQFHLGPHLSGNLSAASIGQLRDHVADVEKVLTEILEEGRGTGEFAFDDLPATISLIHACLGPRDQAPEAVETFVLRAVGAS